VEYALIALLSAVGLFVCMLGSSELGRRIGVARLARYAEGEVRGGGAAEAAVFGLLGLLIAFTFSGAASRFEERRHQITAEANAIGTAYLRIDLLPAAAQPDLRALFRRYTEVRSTTYANSADMAVTKAKLAESAALQNEIWAKANAAFRAPGATAPAIQLLVPALNEMFDITTTRAVATRNHPPLIIFLLLVGLSLVGAAVVGYGTAPNKTRSLFHTCIFAACMSMTVYVILDIEFPRLGLIRIDAADKVLVDLRKSMQ
jgi:hypothetical protein